VKEYVFEETIPPLPSREDELQYLHWLEKEFRSDPWITHRFRKYMAGPKRIPFKNHRELQKEYVITYLLNGSLGILLGWPLAVFVGKKMQSTSSGVPRVPLNRFVHDFPNLDPTHYSRKLFRMGFFSTITLSFFMVGSYLTSDEALRNEWQNRPDFKPYPAMVP
jgi:hypothetical protein